MGFHKPLRFSNRFPSIPFSGDTVDGSEIPNHKVHNHRLDVSQKIMGKNYHINWCKISEPSTVEVLTEADHHLFSLK